MVEAKLRVEFTGVRTNNLMGEKNPFYGETLVKKVVEEHFVHEFDKRVHIAPCGVFIKTKIGENTMEISVNSAYLEHEETDNGCSRYLAFFCVEEKVYELCVWFNVNNMSLKKATLSEWASSGFFDDGVGADNIWDDKQFLTFASI